MDKSEENRKNPGRIEKSQIILLTVKATTLFCFFGGQEKPAKKALFLYKSK